MPDANENLIKGDFHVLIVDDDAVFLELLEALLKSIGIKRVVRADSGVNAYQYLANLKERVDCIICDLNMANGNGLQLLKEVRIKGFKMVRPDACFIMLTAIAHPLAVKTASQLDVNAYLTKPITPDTLKAAIAKARAYFFPLDFDKYNKVQVPDRTKTT